MRAMFFNPKLGRWRQCALALFGLVLALSLHALGFSSAFPAEVRTKQAVVLHLDGAIGPATADYVTDGLKTSAERGAALVILRIDTPGGLDTSMREIIRAILASPIPVATYVSPSGARAASAGTFLLYASHIAAMAPGTNTGAATPVQIAGPLPDGGDETKKAADPMEAKATNDAVAFIRSLAELRGRNADWAEKAVREAASLSAPAALKAGVIDIEARDIPDLLRQMHGRTVTVGGTKVTIDSASLTFTNSPPN